MSTSAFIHVAVTLVCTECLVQTTQLPSHHDNVTLTTIKTDMRIIVTDYYLQVDFYV